LLKIFSSKSFVNFSGFAGDKVAKPLYGGIVPAVGPSIPLALQPAIL
jgi:hypothetical protein